VDALYELFTVLVKLPGWITVFHQLWLSMEHDKGAGINVPPYSEACFCFGLTMRFCHDWI